MAMISDCSTTPLYMSVRGPDATTNRSKLKDNSRRDAEKLFNIPNIVYSVRIGNVLIAQFD
jgi:hypothetical protein